MGDEGGIAADLVRLDETLQDPGDLLYYVYDYGDNWELRLVLEERRRVSDSDPYANAIAGRRGAPPGDCGGLTDGDDLAEVLEDPDAFELDEINEQLRSPSLSLVTHGLTVAWSTLFTGSVTRRSARLWISAPST